MEEIKNLFIKHFGFLPDIISTTEHAYISPPSRVLSSLMELSRYSDKKVLRIIITDTYAIHPENCVRQICLPHLLNKNIFSFKKNFLQKFKEDLIKIENILKYKQIFSLQEINNYIELINLYKKVFKNIKKNNDSITIYNNILLMYIKNLQLDTLSKWFSNTNSFGINSIKIRIFLKEAFNILNKTDPIRTSLFGEYLETRRRLKTKDPNNFIQIINWSQYLKKLDNSLNSCFIPFEIILYIYSYCQGSHFGNDYGTINDINKIRSNNNLLQLTKHNKDYTFNIELNNIKFQKAIFIKNEWTLSHKMYKTINTLSELYIVLGKDKLKNIIKKNCILYHK